jgi:hypothetical protein
MDQLPAAPTPATPPAVDAVEVAVPEPFAPGVAERLAQLDRAATAHVADHRPAKTRSGSPPRPACPSWRSPPARWCCSSSGAGSSPATRRGRSSPQPRSTAPASRPANADA